MNPIEKHAQQAFHQSSTPALAGQEQDQDDDGDAAAHENRVYCLGILVGLLHFCGSAIEALPMYTSLRFQLS